MDNPWRGCASDILGAEMGVCEEGTALCYCFKKEILIMDRLYNEKMLKKRLFFFCSRTCTEHATLELPIFEDCGRQGLYGIIILFFCMDFAVTVPQKGGRTDANTGLDREK